MPTKSGNPSNDPASPRRPTDKSGATDDLERERLEPGLNTGGQGDVGADPGGERGPINSNT